jgi:hypothetical protein
VTAKFFDVPAVPAATRRPRQAARKVKKEPTDEGSGRAERKSKASARRKLSEIV